MADVVTRTVATPGAVAASVRFPLDPDDDGILYRPPELLVVQVVFPAQFVTGIHDHRVPAVIGGSCGYEDNLIYRKVESGLAVQGQRRIEPSDVLVLGVDEAHDVHAPTGTWTGALHVYLGDMYALPRSSWAGADAPEEPFTGTAMESLCNELAEASGLVTKADQA